MSLPLLTAVTHRWESDLAGKLGRSEQVRVVRRCADLAELLGAVAAGIGQVVVVSSDLRGLDRQALGELQAAGQRVLGVHPPGDEAGQRALLRWGAGQVLPADADQEQLDAALALLVDAGSLRHPSGAGPRRATTATTAGTGTAATAATTATAGTARNEGSPEGPEQSADDQDPAGSLVVVWGPVGSPGRTTVAIGLAAELADPSRTTLLVDADTYGASVAQCLAVLDEAPGVVAATRAADQGTLDREALAALAPEVSPGLRVLTGLPRADRWPELREHAFADVLQVCTALARWTVVDVGFCLEQDEELSFDTAAPRRNGATLAALSAADHVVVVGTGDPVGLQRLVRGLDQLGQVSTAPRSVVVTRVRASAVGSNPETRVQEALHRFAGVSDPVLVPEDRAAVDAAVLSGRTLREHRPHSVVRTALHDLAERLDGRAPQPARRSRRWQWGRAPSA